MAQDFRKLTIWNEAITFATKVYAMCKKFPKEEQFALTSQLHRASVSVSANIAEGAGRHSRADFAHFLDVAQGSLNEVQSLVEIAKEVGYISKPFHTQLTQDAQTLGRSLGAFRRRLRQV